MKEANEANKSKEALLSLQQRLEEKGITVEWDFCELSLTIDSDTFCLRAEGEYAKLVLDANIMVSYEDIVIDKY